MAGEVSPEHAVAVAAKLGSHPPDGAVAEPLHKAYRLLAACDRSEAQMRSRLTAGGFEPETVDEVVEILSRKGLLDDEALALAWAVKRARRRGLAGRALVAELVAKGIDEEVARRAADQAVGDEEAHAVRWAAKLFPKVWRYPLPEQGVRLMALLCRRGISEEAAENAARKVLPPQGWD